MAPPSRAPDLTILIPARYASTRFPGKALAPIRGATGAAKPLVQRSWEAACAAADPSRIWVLTDNSRIREAVLAFGGQAAMTSRECRNGSERCAEFAARRSLRGLIVNLQGDAPLTPPALIHALVDALRSDPAAGVATPVFPLAAAAGADADPVLPPGGVTAIGDALGHALYFSRQLLPWRADDAAPAAPVWQHVGAYAYRAEALRDYASRPVSPAEASENLEQLRFLHWGTRIRLVEITPPPGGLAEVNHRQDVAPVERALAQRGIV